MKSDFVLENILPHIGNLSVEELDEIIALADKAKLEQLKRQTLPGEIKRLVDEYKKLGGDIGEIEL